MTETAGGQGHVRRVGHTNVEQVCAKGVSQGSDTNASLLAIHKAYQYANQPLGGRPDQRPPPQLTPDQPMTPRPDPPPPHLSA
jgi:hypothetical protein